MTDPLRRLTPVVRVAPAKLNLTLAVTGRRADGFHELHSVMVPLGLADSLSVAIAGGDADTLHVHGADTGPTAENLVLRAVAATRRAVGRGWPGGSGPGLVAGSGAGARNAGAGGGFGEAPFLAARLAKRIPVAAGLAGGSTDGAAAIDAAVEAWSAELPADARAAVARALGSDVSFFLAGGPAIVEGRGERVTALPSSRGPAGVLLVTPAIHVSTADVFAAFDAGARSRDPDSTLSTSGHLAEEWRRGLDARRLFDRAGVLAPANDLLAATALVAPAVVGVRRALVRLLGRPVGQSGSGPTCWVLYPSLADATAAAVTVNAAIASGALAIPGTAPAFVHATTIAPATAWTEPAAPSEAIPPGGIVDLDREPALHERRLRP